MSDESYVTAGASASVLTGDSQPYRSVVFASASLASTLRAAAEWLDEAERKLREPLLVGGMHYDYVAEDGNPQPWQLSLFVLEEEVAGADME